MNDAPPSSLAVFVSGSSTLLEAMINAGLDVSLIVVDRECRGTQLAQERRIEPLFIDRPVFGWSPSNGWGDDPLSDESSAARQACSRWLAGQVNTREIDLVAMAGFMTKLGSDYFDLFPHLTLNSHPALLPKYKGADAVADTLASGDTHGGTTIHVATAKLDEGPILAQKRVPVMAGDSVVTLHERIKKVERALYSEILREIMTHGPGRLLHSSTDSS